MRDGVTIYTDIYRPVTEEKVPGIIAWSPYGKSSCNAPRYTNMFAMIGIPDEDLSCLQKFEGPDPAWWCARGYAVCHPDPRGIVHSEGNVVMLGSQEAEDCYDYIEWLAEQEWPDYYSEKGQQERLKFFDHYLKGIDNGWENTPVVQYSLMDMAGNNVNGLPSETFPPEGTSYKKLFLNGGARIMAGFSTPANIPSPVPSVHTPPLVPQASFLYTAEERTELVGYPKLKLWAETKDTDDMDIFVLVQKMDQSGNVMKEITIPNKSARIHDNGDYGATVTVYPGTSGILRLSMRHLDEEKTTDINPAYTFDRSEKLASGEIVPVEVELAPIGLVMNPGESLRLIVSTRNILGAMMPLNKPYVPQNKGSLVIHSGGQYDSYLQIPVTK